MTRRNTKIEQKQISGAEAKLALQRAGIPQLRAAPLLGVTFEHLNRCLNGHRESRSLLRDVVRLAGGQMTTVPEDAAKARQAKS